MQYSGRYCYNNCPRLIDHMKKLHKGITYDEKIHYNKILVFFTFILVCIYTACSLKTSNFYEQTDL